MLSQTENSACPFMQLNKLHWYRGHLEAKEACQQSDNKKFSSQRPNRGLNNLSSSCLASLQASHLYDCCTVVFGVSARKLKVKDLRVLKCSSTEHLIADLFNQVRVLLEIQQFEAMKALRSLIL